MAQIKLSVRLVSPVLGASSEWIPKGTLIDDISNKFIKQIEDWLNNYPRAMFDYKSSNMLLLNI